MLVPMIGLVQVGMQARADRYMYLPQIGLSIALAFEVRDRVAGRRALRIGAASAALLALAALAIAARIQLATWRDTEALFQHALAATGENFLAEHALGESRLKRGDADGALPYLAEALRLHPHGVVRGTLADALARQGKLDEAIWNDAEAVRDWPESADLRMRYGQLLLRRGWVDEALRQYAAALALDARNDRGERAARIQLLRAEAWTARKRPDRAIEAYEQALALDPDLVEARAGLVLARLDATDPQEAADTLAAALAGGLDQPALHFGLANAFDRLGRQAEAIEHYRIALGGKPDSIEGANNLAWLLATARDPGLRNPGEALAWALAAARASGRSDPRVLDTLAVSLAAAGRFDEAVAELDAALALLGDAAPREQVDALRARREHFAAHRPCCEAGAPGS
jgi:tetratricopeptide (TPR) repeat protein